MPNSRAFTLIEVPFHMGLRDVGVGKGPGRIIASGADEILAYRGVPAQVQHVSLLDKSCEGMDAIVDISRQVRLAVRQAVEQQIVPVVVSGNCNACLGTLGGLDSWRLGMVWLDAHPDFHTPETSISGFLDGMALAAAVGDCHEELRARIGVGEPVDKPCVLLPAARDIDPGERERVAAAGFASSVEQLGERVESVYLHIDTDFIGPGGPSPEQGAAMVAAFMRELPVVAVGVANWNPDLDSAGEKLHAIMNVLRALAS